MKKFYILSLLILGLFAINSSIYGQCTPDPDCTDPEGDGEYCPTEFPNAIEDEYYDQTLTVIAPTEQGGFTLHHVDVLGIENIPPGMNYQCQDDDCTFYPATPKCISVFGTPAVGSWGEYNLYLTIEIFINVVGNPVSIGTFTDSTAVVYIEPQLMGNFLVDGGTPDELCNNYESIVEYSGNATEGAEYIWDFGENINVISGEGQGPIHIEYYSSEYVGMDSISLYVEEGIYTSPVYTIAYYVDVCGGISGIGNQHVSVYPNPFDGNIEIKGFNTNGIIRIYDLTAKEVFSSEFNNDQFQYNLENLQSGIYLISIETQNNITTQKIVKR